MGSWCCRFDAVDGTSLHGLFVRGLAVRLSNSRNFSRHHEYFLPNHLRLFATLFRISSSTYICFDSIMVAQFNRYLCEAASTIIWKLSDIKSAFAFSERGTKLLMDFGCATYTRQNNWYSESNHTCFIFIMFVLLLTLDSIPTSLQQPRSPPLSPLQTNPCNFASLRLSRPRRRSSPHIFS